MAGGSQPPLWAVSLYLKLPPVWKILGKQFLLIAVKPPGPENGPLKSAP
jgi:hypothetical protein